MWQEKDGPKEKKVEGKRDLGNEEGSKGRKYIYKERNYETEDGR